MKILSIIIPAYNSELYLDKCINSLLSDAVINKLDIIIVDDGSTDQTAVIADSYGDKYPNSISVIHQANSGHGGAVNAGCAQAVGKYLKVLDADDTFVTENLVEFISALNEIDSDVVLTHYYTMDIVSGEIEKWMCYPKAFSENYTISDILSYWNDYTRCVTLHGIAYRTDFYKKYAYMLSEKVFYEDHELSTFPFCWARSVMPIDIFIYKYRIGDISQSVSDNNRVLRMKDMASVLYRFVSEYNLLSDSSVIREFVCEKIKILLLSYLTTALLVEKGKSGRDKAKAMMEYFKSTIPRVYEKSLKQYRVFRILNFFGFGKKTFDRILRSGLYSRLKGTRGFN